MAAVHPPRAALAVVSGTTLRFVCLVAAVLGTSTAAFSNVYGMIPALGLDAAYAYAGCSDAHNRALPSSDLDPLQYADASERVTQDFLACVAPSQHREAAWQLAGLGLLVLVALALYLAAPWRIRRRGRLTPLTADRFPALSATLVELCAVAGLRRVPEFVVGPYAGTPGGMTFGRLGRYTVRLNAGLVPSHTTDPGTFRAIVLHELAHIRNRDVDLGYAAVALSQAFVAVALLPMLVAIAYPTLFFDPSMAPWSSVDYAPTLLVSGGRGAVFVLLIYLTRNAVLRSRELHADARAAATGGAEGLRRAVASTRAVAGRWFAVHPVRERRLRAIDDPDVLLGSGFGEMLVAGLLTIIAASTIQLYAGLGLPYWASPTHRLVAWFVAPLAAGILGVAAWRAEVLSARRGVRVPVLGSAVGFGLGWLLGDVLAATSLVGTPSYADVGVGVRTSIVAGLVLLAGIACQAAVSAAGARCWLPVLRGTNTRGAWAAGVIATAVPFAIWYGIWSQIRNSADMSYLYDLSAAFGAYGYEFWRGPASALLAVQYGPLDAFRAHPLAIPALALAWLYPLAARLRRPTGSTASIPPQGSVVGVPPRLNVRLALIVGAAGGGAFVVLLLAARAVLHRFAPDLIRVNGFSPYFYDASIAAGVAIQAVAGGLLAARHRPLGLSLGQLAAVVTAVLAAVGMRAVQMFGSCVPAFRLTSSCSFDVDPGYVLGLLRLLVVEGALAALIVGAVVTVVAALASRLPERLRPRRPLLSAAAHSCAVLLVLGAGAFAASRSYGPSFVDSIHVKALPTRPGAVSPPTVRRTAAPTPMPRAAILTDDQAEAAALAAGAGLPSYWHETARTGGSDGSGGSGGGIDIEPPECQALAMHAFVDAIGEGVRGSATVDFATAGTLTVSYLYVTVTSYEQPPPDSVFATADAAKADCARFTVTTNSGSGLGHATVYKIAPSSPPQLGDHAWRLNLDTTSGRVTGAFDTVLMRTGHTLITVVATALSQPVNEAVLLDALTRAVAATS